MLRTDGTVLQVTKLNGDVVDVVTKNEAMNIMIEAADAISYMRQDQVEIIANELALRFKRTPEYLLDLADRQSHL